MRQASHAAASCSPQCTQCLPAVPARPWCDQSRRCSTRAQGGWAVAALPKRGISRAGGSAAPRAPRKGAAKPSNPGRDTDAHPGTDKSVPQQPGAVLDLPTPEFARVRTAEFAGSAVDLAGCPPATLPEFALIGRSNVGKSSLINLLTQQPRLAKVSKEPGMTKTINHFLINSSWYLVDLPGYGFAKTAGKDARAAWLDFTKAFFVQRTVLVSVLLLVDASIPPQAVDLECANWLAESQVPFALVFTKTDARKKGGPTPGANMKAFKAELLRDYEALPPCFETSAASGAGHSELLAYLAQMRALEQAEA